MKTACKTIKYSIFIFSDTINFEDLQAYDVADLLKVFLLTKIKPEYSYILYNPTVSTVSKIYKELCKSRKIIRVYDTYLSRYRDIFPSCIVFNVKMTSYLRPLVINISTERLQLFYIDQ
jgi:hypothetical protein